MYAGGTFKPQGLRVIDVAGFPSCYDEIYMGQAASLSFKLFAIHFN
jgi:hypothetical protein